jgi:hypothetical protein
MSWFAIPLCLMASSVARAEQWAKDMFDRTSHDFGTVARGAAVEHRFALENIYVEDVHVAKVVSTCKCHNAKIVNPTLKTYEQGEIVVKIDTRKFIGRKDATVRVVFDKPYKAEVQLQTYCYIRSDVVFEPGSAQFGSIQRGAEAEKKLTVNYAGRSDWKIVEVESPQPYLDTEIREVSRSVSDAMYELVVRLKGTAPVGYIRDHLMLVTNDHNPKARRVPIAVEATVAAAITARPSPLPLGVLRTGQTVTRNLVVQAKSPFRILKITGPDERFRFALSDAPKPLQLVPVTFAAGDDTGKVGGTIRIETDLGGSEIVEVGVDGQVLSTGATSSLPTDSGSSSENKTGTRWQPLSR